MSGSTRTTYTLDTRERVVIEAMRASDRVREAVYNYVKGFDPRAASGVENRERYGEFGD